MALSDVTITLDPLTLLTWAFVGLVAGFLASRVMLGHGMGILADIVVGVVGAIGAGLLAGAAGITVRVPGHPIISEIVIGFVGAVILLAMLRVFGMGRRRRTPF